MISSRTSVFHGYPFVKTCEGSAFLSFLLFCPKFIVFSVHISYITAFHLFHYILCSSCIIRARSQIFFSFVRFLFARTFSQIQTIILCIMFSPQIKWSCSQCRSTVTDRRKYCTNCHSMLTWTCIGWERFGLYIHLFRYHDKYVHCTSEIEDKSEKIEGKRLTI